MVSAFMNCFRAACQGGGDERSGGLHPGDLDARIESNRSLSGLARDLGLRPSEVVAVLAFGALGDGRHAVGPPVVSGRASVGAWSPYTESSLADLYPAATRTERLALSAGLLQIYDYWEASHAAAQEADELGEKKVSAYWHGIAHRREPDPGNASYWFRRVGRHPVFGPLAGAAAPLLEDQPDLAGRLLPRGSWDPFAFIDLCNRAGGEQVGIARRLQRLEMLLLLEASLPAES